MVSGTMCNVECPQGLVPSVVWVASAEERVHLRRNIGASALEVTFKVRRILGEWEVSVSGFGLASSNGNGVDSAVEGRPQVSEKSPAISANSSGVLG